VLLRLRYVESSTVSCSSIVCDLGILIMAMCTLISSHPLSKPRPRPDVHHFDPSDAVRRSRFYREARVLAN